MTHPRPPGAGLELYKWDPQASCKLLGLLTGCGSRLASLFVSIQVKREAYGDPFNELVHELQRPVVARDRCRHLASRLLWLS